MSDKHLENVTCNKCGRWASACICDAESSFAAPALLGITDTDRMDWLERQQPNTLIVEPGIVTNSLRLMVDEMIKRERSTVKPNVESSHREI